MTVFNPDQPLVHICETCGKEEVMSSKEGYLAGWDYPPHFGDFKILFPRTCGDCGIDTTLWWRVMIAQKNDEEYNLTDDDLALVARIEGEPESIMPKEKSEEAP